jgi:hypothetical protein
MGPLGGHDAGDARCREHISLGGITGSDQLECRRGHRDPAFGDRCALRCRLVADIDHLGLAAIIEVREFRHAAVSLPAVSGSLP